jgi:glycerol-3-phosphate cytidylyltransferase
MAVIYTGGTFDLFHAGHVDLLRRCSYLGEVVIVSLNTDEFILEYKGHLPINTYEERKAVLESCRYVSEVIPNSSGSDSKPAILSVMPQYIVIGSDWLKKDYCKQMNFTPDWLEENGITLAYVPRMRDLSTTQIKGRVND